MSTTYDIIESNIRKTIFLIVGFLILIIGLGWYISWWLGSPIILILAIIFSIAMSFLSFWESDKIIFSITGASEIDKKDLPFLYRIVENLSITSGLPMPKIYLINDQAPNAFATGRDPKHSAIAITSGLLEKLDKSEIEGVIAHEMSHIQNRDTLISTVVVVLVGFITILADWFLRIGFWRDDRDEGDGGNLRIILGILGFIFIILSPLVAKIIQFAVSRKREFLADGSAALMTRYPEGLARALEKISQDQTKSKYDTPSLAHLYIVSPFKGEGADKWFNKIFSTHPPIEERIKILRNMNL